MCVCVCSTWGRGAEAKPEERNAGEKYLCNFDAIYESRHLPTQDFCVYFLTFSVVDRLQLETVTSIISTGARQI